MLKVIDHFKKNEGKCPVNESELSADKFDFVQAHIKRYAVKLSPFGSKDAYDVFMRVAAAFVVAGRAPSAEELARSAFIVMEAAAKAGFADMDIDFRNQEDKDAEAAAQ